MLLKKRLPLLIAALLACALLAPLAQAGEPSEVVRKGITRGLGGSSGNPL